MRRAVVVSMIARLKAGMLGAVAAFAGTWWRGSVVVVLMTLSLPLLGEGASGALDPTFGVGGKVTTDFGDVDKAHALLLQPDGKLVVAGDSGPGDTADFALARYLPNGSLDPTFGTGGKVTTDFGATVLGNPAAATARALVLQPDGKLVVAGAFAANFALARYLSDGSLDPTFGPGGKVTTAFDGLLSGAQALVLQPNDKLVAAGEVQISFKPDFALVRYLPDGSLDPSFGVGGKVTTAFDGLLSGAQALVLQVPRKHLDHLPDGKLVVAGTLDGAFGNSPVDFVLACYLPDGSLDLTCGPGGKVTTDFGDVDKAHALLLQPDGKLVAAGESAANFALARYASPLVLD